MAHKPTEFKIHKVEQYPKDGLSSGRPKVIIPSGVNDISIAAGMIIKLANSDVWDLDWINLYLWLWFEELKYTLDKDWISHDITIGKTNDEITPRNLIEKIEGSQISQTDNSAVVLHRHQKIGLAMVVTSFYEMESLENSTNSKIVMKRITAEYNRHRKITGFKPVFELMKSKSKRIATDANYRKLIAVFDMFASKIGNQDFSTVRFCTIGSRMRDCAALSDFAYVLSITGLSKEEFTQLIFVESVLLDLGKILEPNQEVDQSDSYTHYLLDLKLCDKSPYSASNIPHLTFLIHAIGCYLRNSRSTNAEKPFNAHILPIINNAAMINYILSHRSAEDKQEAEARRPDINIQANRNEIPIGINQSDWKRYLQTIGDEEILKNSYQIWADLNTRKQTIGNFLKQYSQGKI